MTAPKPRRSVREESRAAYRQAILEAAMRVFGSTGFRDAKMNDIASEAGVATGTLYNYFTSKEEIFQSILDDGRDRLMNMLAECEAVADPIERLRTQVRSLLGFLEEHGVLFAIYMQLGLAERHTLEPRGDACDDDFRRALLSSFNRSVVEARGRIRADHSPELLASLFGGLINGLIMRWIDSQFQSGLAVHTDALLDVFLHGAGTP